MMAFARGSLRRFGRYDGIQFPSLIIYCFLLIRVMISSEVGILSGINCKIVILSVKWSIFDAWRCAEEVSRTPDCIDVMRRRIVWSNTLNAQK